MPRLIIKNQGDEQIFDMFEDELTIGSGKDNICCVDATGIADRHCRIFQTDYGFKAEDLAGAGDTTVNGKAAQDNLLRAGDIIRIGTIDVEFQWLLGEAEEFLQPPLESADAEQEDGSSTPAEDDTRTARLGTGQRATTAAEPESEEPGEDEEDAADTATGEGDAEEAPEEADEEDAATREQAALDDSEEPDEEKRPARYGLIVLSKNQSFAEVEINKERMTIGRARSRDISISDEAASGKHAEIVQTPEGCRLIDETSRNGTFLRGKRVTDHPLESGDVIRIGKTELRFIDSDAPPVEGDHSDADAAKLASGGGTRLGSGHSAGTAATKVRRDPLDFDPETPTAEEQIPVRSGDTQPLPRASEVARWREQRKSRPKAAGTDGKPGRERTRSQVNEAAKEPTAPIEEQPAAAEEKTAKEPASADGDSGSLPLEKLGVSSDLSDMPGELGPLDDASGDADTFGAEYGEDGEEPSEAAADNMGPITTMMERGLLKEVPEEDQESLEPGPAAGKGAEEEEEHDTTSSSKKAPPKEKKGPKRASKRVSRRTRRGGAKRASLVGTAFALLVSVTVIGSALWFVLRNDPGGNGTTGGTKTGGAKRPVGAAVPDGPEGLAGDDVAPLRPSRAQLAFRQTPFPDLPEIRTARVESDPATISSLWRLFELGDGSEEPVGGSRPLNSTKHASDYGDILKHLATEIASDSRQQTLSRQDLMRLKKARELILDFKLKEARQELDRIETPDGKAESIGLQLEIIEEMVEKMGEALASVDGSVSLRQIAPRATDRAEIIGATSSGLMIRKEGGGEAGIRWSRLSAAERYALARKCFRDDVAEHHVCLGILCINLGLPRNAGQEFAQAESLGMAGIERLLKLLKRQPDTLP